MDIAFYKTPGTIEFLPTITLNKVTSGNKYAYCLMFGWLQWILDIQWDSETNT